VVYAVKNLWPRNADYFFIPISTRRRITSHDSMERLYVRKSDQYAKKEDAR